MVFSVLCEPQTQCLCFGMKGKFSQMDIFKSRQKKTACVTRYHQRRWIDKHKQCMHVCLCGGVFGVCVCAAASCTQFCLDLRHNVLLFSSTRQSLTQTSVGLQHEMRVSIQRGGGFVLIPCLGRRTVPCQCLLIPWTHLAYYTGLSLSSTPP